ncbi:ADP-ribosylglycohydrolase family protein [Cytophagaceae bacterium DM2B3-1]|uniref:ADP-ribosylglycohydrolase family protein n=1 Tax=Xanthocytophaga flava TaxID=3048013 RepID=A0ABT7CQC0_9BACT|nr:ADP-ribosylglycohydrolase family protein [Xanthocytophaga flavus]MDJ1495947.1 ADP-ribosylglycohydrolase family protein [Xanthocytophaga flavus]
MNQRNFAKDILFGVAVGDALGVPVEFKDRSYLKQFPVTDMIGYGTYNQPPGTWSDDSSLTFCLAESLCKGYDLTDLSRRFITWREYNHWTPHGHVFDIGIATSDAISRLRKGVSPALAGGKDEQSNGNGSLMRILPLALYLIDKDIQTRFEKTKEVSTITHAHIRSILACFIYLEYALCLIKGLDKWKAFEQMRVTVNQFLDENAVCSDDERRKFYRILGHPSTEFGMEPIHTYEEVQVYSSGYVLHSLEASFWCLLNSNSYSETVLKAVNLGKDTDTTAAIAGGLAGLVYQFEQIPVKWVSQLARVGDIHALSEKLALRYADVV